MMKKNNIPLQNKTVSLKPYVYEKPSISAVCIKIIILLSLQILMLLLTKSYMAFAVILCSTVGSLAASFIHYFFYKKKQFMSLSSMVQGIIIGMLLPENYPLVTAFFISFATLLIFKYIFEESENFWINITGVSVMMAYFIGRNYFPDFLITKDLLQVKNPSVSLISNGVFPVYDFDVAFTGYLNSTLFSGLKVTLPQGILSMLWDTHSVIPAFRFNLLTIIASIVLFSDNSFSIVIPGIFLSVYALLVRLFFPLMSGGAFNEGDIVLALLTSGTLFAAVFMIQWYGTHPMTVVGKIVYALAAGFLAFFILGCGTSPVGMIYVIVICNIFNLMIRQVEEKRMDKLMNKMSGLKQSVLEEMENAGNNK